MAVAVDDKLIRRYSGLTLNKGGGIPVNVQLTIVRQVVANNQRHLLDIEATTPHICGNQNPRPPRSELLHNFICKRIERVILINNKIRERGEGGDILVHKEVKGRPRA